MKNLFSINRTEDTHSVRPDSTPFDAEHIDSALEEQLRQASDAAFEAFDQPLTLVEGEPVRGVEGPCSGFPDPAAGKPGDTGAGSWDWGCC
mgnify:CR=1 FL=1